jgi:hypothetical protein
MTHSASTEPQVDPAAGAKGLLLTVYYNNNSRSCGGDVSRNHEKVVVVGVVDETDPRHPVTRTLPRESRVFTPGEDAPAVVLVIRNLFAGQERTMVLRPLAAPPEGHTPYMAGGSFADTSDSRWHALTRTYGAIPLHDRTDTWGTYHALTGD